jgi:hypothetical protein
MRCTRLFALSIAVGACGGGDEHVPAAPDAEVAPPDAAFSAVCTDGEAVTITGSTPRGTVDELDYLNVTTLGGFCQPRIQLHFTAVREYGHPEPAPRLTIEIDVPDLAGTPLTGDFAAVVRYSDDAGETETTGTFSADAIEPLGEDGSGIRGRLVVDTPAGWSLDLTVDADYCSLDTCV